MALTGLFLCLFLVIHLTGNLQLLIQDDGYKFNSYAKLMTSNPLIKVASYVTYLAILFHAFKGLWLAAKNRGARKRGYRVNAGSANSTWMSRSMGVLGTVILVFIVIHMQQFWYQYKFGKEVDTVTYMVYQDSTGSEHSMLKSEYDSTMAQLRREYQQFVEINPQGNFEESNAMFRDYKSTLEAVGRSQENGNYSEVVLKDLYSVVAFTYTNKWYVLLYVISMIAIGFHLLHGFTSAFQTMGWKHEKYDGLSKAVSYFFGIIIPAGFAAIPLIMYLR